MWYDAMGQFGGGVRERSSNGSALPNVLFDSGPSREHACSDKKRGRGSGRHDYLPFGEEIFTANYRAAFFVTTRVLPRWSAVKIAR